MIESHTKCVEHRAWRGDLLARELAPVDGLSNQRIAILRQMDADLMLTPSREAAFDERRSAEALEHTHIGLRKTRFRRWPLP